jgi:hypothetical protein
MAWQSVGAYQITYAAKSGASSVVAVATASGSGSAGTTVSTGTANTTTLQIFVRNASGTLTDAYVHFAVWTV